MFSFPLNFLKCLCGSPSQVDVNIKETQIIARFVSCMGNPTSSYVEIIDLLAFVEYTGRLWSLGSSGTMNERWNWRPTFERHLKNLIPPPPKKIPGLWSKEGVGTPLWNINVYSYIHVCSLFSNVPNIAWKDWSSITGGKWYVGVASYVRTNDRVF